MEKQKCLHKTDFGWNQFNFVNLTKKKITVENWHFHQMFVLEYSVHDTIFLFYLFIYLYMYYGWKPN